MTPPTGAEHQWRGGYKRVRAASYVSSYEGSTYKRGFAKHHRRHALDPHFHSLSSPWASASCHGNIAPE